MKKGLILFVTCLAPAVCCLGQGPRSWTSGPLTWNDFQIAGPERADTSATSHVSFSLIRENKKVKTKGITYKYQDVSAAIDPKQSWVKAEGQNDRNLRKHQQEFDILQYYAERYREEYMFYTDPKTDRYENYFTREAKHKLDERDYLMQFKSTLEEYRKTGDANAYPVSREDFDITKYPYQLASGASEALFSLIVVVPMGYLAKSFSPAFGFSAGYGYREGKNFFRGDLSVGIIGFKPEGYDPVYGGSFSTRGSYLGLSAKYGRILLSDDHINFSLFAGVGYTSWKEGNLISPPTASGLTLTEGLCMDLHLHRTVDFLAKTPQARDMSLQFRLYADEMYYAAQKTIIPTINFSVGLNIGFRKMSRI